MGAQFDAERLDLLVSLLAPERRTRVVEIGANPINDNPYADLVASGHGEAWGFEADPRAFERLRGSAAARFLPHAIGRGGPAKLHVTRMPSLTSLLRPSAETARFFGRFSRPGTVEAEIAVETRRLDDLGEVPGFDLMKIDVQGGEMQVFEGAAEKLRGAVAVISEVAFVPLYEDQPLLDAQMHALRELGYDLHKFLFLKGFSLRGGIASRLEKKAHGNQLLDGDAVFIRSLRRPDAVSDEQLKQLAILCDAVLESFDVAVRCLDLLIGRGVVEAAAAHDYVDLLPDLSDRARPVRTAGGDPAPVT